TMAQADELQRTCCRDEHVPRDSDYGRQRPHGRSRRLAIRLGGQEGRRGRSRHSETTGHPPTHSAGTLTYRFAGSILAAPAVGASTVLCPSSQRTRSRGGSGASTSSITPVRMDWPTFSASTTMRSPTSAFIVSSFRHVADSPRLSLGSLASDEVRRGGHS